MNVLVLSQGCIILALVALAGCAGTPGSKPSLALSNLSATEIVRASPETRVQWHEEAQELRTFADRHEVEAEVLLRHPLPIDAQLIRQRRALARQLRAAAEQIEERADEMQ